jgi:hypothetical protein
MHMTPVGWTKRSVRLQCGSCGSRMNVEWLPYISALESGVPMQCRECGVEGIPGDRRQTVAPVSEERRLAGRT